MSAKAFSMTAAIRMLKRSIRSSVVALVVLALLWSCAGDGSGNGSVNRGDAGAAAWEGGASGAGAGADRSDTAAGGGQADGDAGNSGAVGRTGNGATTLKVVGRAGGSIILVGGSAGPVTIAIPADALSESTTISITETTDPPPAGYTTYSPVYEFQPAGTVFNKPVAVTLPFDGDARLATLFWSREGASGYERNGGVPTGATLTGAASHFSRGFVANGVDYTDSPDRSCVVTNLIEGRTAGYVGNLVGFGGEELDGAPPSSVAMFYTVDDCQGHPVTGLQDSDFTVEEDGTNLSSEAVPTLLPKPGLTIFASLVLDMSSSTQNELTSMIDGAKAFVNRLQANDNQLKVPINIELFSGDSTLTEWQPSTLETDTLLAQLTALSSYKPADPSSTNLYGAVVQSLRKLQDIETGFKQRNYGGALTSGYAVLFTDGADTAGLQTLTQALAAEAADTSDQVLAVGLQSSPDYNSLAQSQLAQLAQGGLISSDASSTLARDFEALAARIAGQTTRTYLLGYCSPKRSGQHTVSVSVAGAKNQTNASYQFTASGFGPGCTKAAFADACDGRQCGGLACGTCDDRSASCGSVPQRAPVAVTPTTCVGFCKQQGKCGGAMIVNARGYSEVCNDAPDSTSCNGVCTDLTIDNANCGACGHACVGGLCGAGTCHAPNVLASGQSPFAVAVDASAIYWTNMNDRSVKRLGLNGGSPTNLATLDSLSTPGAIAVDDSSVYWTTTTNFDGSIMKIGKGGGTSTTLRSGSTPFGDIALDQANLYWRDIARVPGSESASITIMKLALVGGAATTIAGTKDTETGIAVDATNVYFSAGGSIMQVGLGGGVATALAPGRAGAFGIAVDADHLFWANMFGNNIAAVEDVVLGGGVPSTLATEQGTNSIVAIAADASGIYWADGGAIMRSGRNGGEATKLAVSYEPRAIALDASNVYWITTQAVMSIGKWSGQLKVASLVPDPIP